MKWTAASTKGTMRTKTTHCLINYLQPLLPFKSFPFFLKHVKNGAAKNKIPREIILMGNKLY